MCLCMLKGNQVCISLVNVRQRLLWSLQPAPSLTPANRRVFANMNAALAHALQLDGSTEVVPFLLRLAETRRARAQTENNDDEGCTSNSLKISISDSQKRGFYIFNFSCLINNNMIFDNVSTHDFLDFTQIYEPFNILTHPLLQLFPCIYTPYMELMKPRPTVPCMRISLLTEGSPTYHSILFKYYRLRCMPSHLMPRGTKPTK